MRLGKIAFAPDTPAVRQLVAHLNASHAFFNEHLAGVWPTEAAAVAELNKAGFRLFTPRLSTRLHSSCFNPFTTNENDVFPSVKALS